MSDDDLPFKKPDLPPARKPKKPPELKPQMIKEGEIPPKVPAEPEEEVDEENFTTIIGLPSTEFTPDELSYIGEREGEILERLGTTASKGAKPLINEVIQTDIEIRRLDSELVKIRKRFKSDLPKLAAETKAAMSMRNDLMIRMTDAMRNLGIMPKDYIQTDVAAASMSDLHKKYRAELDRRRAEGNPIGTLSAEAKQLVMEVGSIPEQYKSPRALSDTTRQQIIEEEESK